MPVVVRHPSKPLVLFTMADQLLACHAGCFNKRLFPDYSSRWWHCALCGAPVSEMAPTTSSGVWPGSAINIPPPSRAGAGFNNFVAWIAAWLEVPAESLEVSIEWS